MDFKEFSLLLTRSFTENSLEEPSEHQAKQFYALCEHLLEVNQQMNLTAIREIPEVVTKHFVDSCFAAEHISESATVLDIGCGAGFPTLPLAILRPDLKITAMDSTDKKVRFVAETAQLLSLNNVTTVSGRAEDRALIGQLCKFDVVTSRAVSRLCILGEIAIPYLKIGGTLVALKGSDGENELKEAKRGLEKLGCNNHSCIGRDLRLLSGVSEARTILLIKKSSPTPSIYPRAYNAIKKAPLL